MRKIILFPASGKNAQKNYERLVKNGVIYQETIKIENAEYGEQQMENMDTIFQKLS